MSKELIELAKECGALVKPHKQCEEITLITFTEEELEEFVSLIVRKDNELEAAERKIDMARNSFMEIKRIRTKLFCSDGDKVEQAIEIAHKALLKLGSRDAG